MSTAAPSAVHSTAEPATNPAIQDAQAAKSNKSKEKKGKAAPDHPLEVFQPRFIFRGNILMTLQMNPPPAFFEHRNKIFDKLQVEYNEWVARKFES